MNIVVRPYKKQDYPDCESLVEQVWKLSSVFKTPGLSDVATLAYTQGSLEESNYRRVVTVDNEVAGFIFALNDKKAGNRSNVLFKIKVAWGLFWIKGPKAERNHLMSALKTHVSNRSTIVERGRSEVLLFIVGNQYQGCGLGKKLWHGFRKSCCASGVESIFVSTNKLGAAGFYERLGFSHLGDFDSPLHEIAGWQGQPCMHVFNCT